ASNVGHGAVATSLTIVGVLAHSPKFAATLSSTTAPIAVSDVGGRSARPVGTAPPRACARHAGDAPAAEDEGLSTDRRFERVGAGTPREQPGAGEEKKRRGASGEEEAAHRSASVEDQGPSAPRGNRAVKARWTSGVLGVASSLGR